MGIVNVRLSGDEEAYLGDEAAATGRTRSDVVRESIALHRQRNPRVANATASLYERIAPFVGAIALGRRDLSVRSGDKFRDALTAKRKRA